MSQVQVEHVLRGWWPFTEGHEPWYRRWWPVLLLVAAAVVFVAVSLATVAYGYYRAAEVPPADQLRPEEPTVVYDAQGDRVATLDPAAVQRNVDLDELPDHVWQAVLAAEDRGFFEHPGFSVTRILAAFENNLLSDEVEGASTITQQYVEIAIREVPRTYLGKLREAATAYKVEQRYTKEQILRFYLNKVSLGRGTQGIAAAAATYLRKPPSELTVEESALLAGMIAAPTRFAPDRNPDLAEIRRDYTLRGMVEQGWLSQARAQEIIASPLPDVHETSPVDIGPNAYYLDVVRDRLAEQLPDHRDPFLGLEVHTTLDQDLQRLALETLNDHLSDVPYTGSLVSVDPRDGAVRTIVGGLDYEQQQFNIALQGPQQPGSAFKTITLSAFVTQGWSPRTTYDAPATYRIQRQRAPDHTVENHGGQGHGEVDVRTATIRSINTVYVQLQQDVGTQAVIQQAHRMGIDRELREVPTLTLGTVEVTPFEMAEAYATLAANGQHRPPYLLTEVRDRRSGETVTGNAGEEPSDDGSRGMPSNAAAVVTDVLVDNIQRGTGTSAQIGRPAAGKTGTTQDLRDAWFVGYVPQLTTAVWIGREDDGPMDGVTGGSIPAETWGDFMAQALEGVPVARFPEPDIGPLQRFDDPDPAPTPTAAPTEPATEPTTSSPTPTDTDPDSPSPTYDVTPPGSPSPTDGRSPTGSPSPSPTADDDGGLLPPQTVTNDSSGGG